MSTTTQASPVFHPKDRSKIALVMLAMCGFAHLNREKMRARWLPKHSTQDKHANGLVVDHPVFGYLVENFSIGVISYLVARFAPAMNMEKPVRTYLVLLASFLVMVDPLLLIQKLLAGKAYAHVPWFSERAPSSEFKVVFKDFMCCNAIVVAFSSALQMGFASVISKDNFDKMFGDKPTSIRLLPLLAKFVFCRLFVDVVFGVLHRLMHESPLLYKYVHKRHHEHQTPRTQTNYHFTWLDLYFEASFPVYSAIGALWAMGYTPSRYEVPFLAVTLMYFEMASHTGKEIPIVTWFPLLSPVVGYLTGCDERLIEYHTRHHQLFRCNYSISPWLDMLWGTYRIDLPDSYGNVKSTIVHEE